MSNLHLQSVRSPFDDPRLASAAIGALARADAMGLLPRPVTCLDEAAIRGLGTGMAEAGIGRGLLAELHRLPCSDAVRLSTLLEKIVEALDQSPAPEHEWKTLQDVVGVELLARLLGLSQSSARRYISGSRSTPDGVAARLHFLAFVVGDLAGAYDEIGVRRWFDRPRERLDGDSPAQALGEGWSPADDGPRRVRDLARALASSSALKAAAASLVQDAPQPGAVAEAVGHARARLVPVAEARRRMAERAGPGSPEALLSSDEVAMRLGLKTRQSVHDWRRKGRLLGWQGARRGYVFPAGQLDDRGRPLDGLQRIGDLFGDAYAAWVWMTTPKAALDDECPLALLAGGDVDRAVEIAEGDLQGDFA